ncbi:hypothetical protein M514_25194 [Trichuris suis]|uniref:Uncharacterized protein n=1 Tax=Trichuris suis TaxID=68888 RepID=A0A085MZI0_9BILA|nr:hypothetical protein M514_25194 [Trichuris suis]
MRCSATDCKAHRLQWKQSQNGDHFKAYLACLDQCIAGILGPPVEAALPPPSSRASSRMSSRAASRVSSVASSRHAFYNFCNKPSQPSGLCIARQQREDVAARMKCSATECRAYRLQWHKTQDREDGKKYFGCLDQCIAAILHPGQPAGLPLPSSRASSRVSSRSTTRVSSHVSSRAASRVSSIASSRGY